MRRRSYDDIAYCQLVCANCKAVLEEWVASIGFHWYSEMAPPRCCSEGKYEIWYRDEHGKRLRPERWEANQWKTARR